jgi:hypothetical protein
LIGKKKTPWRIKLLKKKHNLKSNRDRKEREKKIQRSISNKSNIEG